MGWDTGSERLLRSLLHRVGYFSRLQRTDLPGRTDIVLPQFATALLVYWYRHPGCKRATTPASNTAYRDQKFIVLQRRQNQKELEVIGWRVLIVWECELKNLPALQAQLSDYFNPLCIDGAWQL